MIQSLLIIRLKQLYRVLSGIGLFRTIFLMMLFGFTGLFIYTKAIDEATSQWVSNGFVFLIIVIHLKRGDKLFLKNHFHNYKLILLSEYVLISLPLIAVLLIHRQWASLLSFSALLLIVHLDLRYRYSSLNTRLQSLIPSDAYEWKAGVRKQLFFIAAVWLASSATSFFIGSVPFAILILGLIIFSFYEKAEPYQMIVASELNARKFISLKVKRQIQLFSVLTLPLAGIFLVFHIDRWYIPLAEIVLLNFIHIYLIMNKYAFFEPGKRSPAAQTIGAIGVLGGIIPVFLPVVWLLSVWFYQKSISNLNFYLDDYNQ